MNKRTTSLETVNGQQFLSRYHDNEREYFALKDNVIIGCSKYNSGVLVLVRSDDGVFDCISDIQIDKEENDKTEIYIHSRGIESLQLNHSDVMSLVVNNNPLKDVVISIDNGSAKQFKEKKFFDI